MKAQTIGLLASAVFLAGCTPAAQRRARIQGQAIDQQTQQGIHAAQKALSSDAVTARVRAAMGSSQKLDTSHIGVDTNKNIVTLRGTVPSADQQKLAERIARDTLSPKFTVKSFLRVDSSGR
ncbi:MAG TPA: BON domain-containing protein [Chthonomonadales bacterium]|nr:BON domain-containing protein [Chthonomonadales bacterium]